MRRTLATLVALATTSATLVLAGGATATGDEGSARGEPRPLRYVAMGDSYSAASGVLPLDPTAPPQCLRSSRNYPHVLAGRLARRQRPVRLTDVTCGAAETRDYFEPQYDGVPPQLEALTRRTRLVTMTIGGNDNGVFVGAIAKCGTAGLAALGRGNPCEEQYGRSFVRTIRHKTRPALVKALRAVHRRAPRARVAILGYPWIVPREVGCFARLPVAEGDVPYLRNIQRVLNRAVERAARRTGSTYLDLNRVSHGHDACQDLGVRWVEPVVTSTNPVVVHPNALGERKMARRALQVLRR